MANETASFTVGVFKDLEWATKAFEALERQGFNPKTVSVMVRDTPQAAAFVETRLGKSPDRLQLILINARCGWEHDRN